MSVPHLGQVGLVGGKLGHGKGSREGRLWDNFVVASGRWPGSMLPHCDLLTVTGMVCPVSIMHVTVPLDANSQVGLGYADLHVTCLLDCMYQVKFVLTTGREC